MEKTNLHQSKKVKSGAIAIFVKTIGLSPVKTRLAKDIGKDKAHSFYQYSKACVEAAASEASNQHSSNIDIIWAIAEKEAMHHREWAAHNRIHQGSGSLGERLHEVYHQLLQTYDFVLLLGADSPQISPKQIREAADHLLEASNSYVIGPSVDGGFWLFGGCKELSLSSWMAVPYSQNNTYSTLLKQLDSDAGLCQLDLVQDVDFYEDLISLKKQFASMDSLLPSQADLGAWLKPFN